MCLKVSKYCMTMFFQDYIYTCFFKSTSLTVCKPHLEIWHTFLQADAWKRLRVCTYTSTHYSTLSQSHIQLLFRSIQAPVWVPACCFTPSLLSIRFLPGAFSCPPRVQGLRFPSSSSLGAIARIRFWKGASFLCTVDSWYIPDNSWI